MQREKLYLFTSQFPYGTSENFIEPELNLLAEVYKEIHIFPIQTLSNVTSRLTPANVIVHPPIHSRSIGIGEIIKFKYLRLFLSEFFSCKWKIKLLKRIKPELRNLVQCDQRAEEFIRQYGAEITKTHCYVFWMEDWATTLSLIKRNNPEFKFLCRAHGYDLFHERRDEGFISWRMLQLKYTNNVAAVSKFGANYLKQNFPYYSSKFKVSYLGTTGERNLLVPQDNDRIRLVSCSGLIPLKRVKLICQLILELPFEVNWVHFGDGEEMTEIKKMIDEKKSTNVTVELKGNISNQKLIEYYFTNPVHVFVHLSSSEGGVPIAIQEAVSFGIPILANNAGGVGEIVNSETGYLLDPDFSHSDFHSALKWLLKNASINHSFRKNTQEIWKKKFDLKIASEGFIHLLSSKDINVY